MKRSLPTSLLLLSWLLAFPANSADLPKKPKLILALVVDQFRYDYLSRFRGSYTGGFKTLLDQGAVFEDAHHISYPTVTAVGHSTFLSGATPAQSGIAGNEWYDRREGSVVTSVSDPGTKLVGGKPGAAGSSPKRLLVSTVGDELKMSGQDSHVIGISIKDRSAILPAGHMADAAYWYDSASHKWVTSDYYAKSLPAWVEAANHGTPRGVAGDTWMPIDATASATAFCKVGEAVGDVAACGAIEATPWGNEVIEDLAERALVEEKMGRHGGTDLLAVSFSANDYVGHAVGPDDPRVRDMAIRTDRLIGQLIDRAEKAVGPNNVVVVLTADHGVGPVPEVSTARRMPGGRIVDADLRGIINAGLTAKYGEGNWLMTIPGLAGSFYLDLKLIQAKKLDQAEVEAAAADALRADVFRKSPDHAGNSIFRVYTKHEIMRGQIPRDPVSEMITNGFFPDRDPDLIIILNPFYLAGASATGKGTSHGTPFNYDSHVPVIFLGNGIRPGHYYTRIAVTDIAPTLSAMAGVLEPSGSVGRVLSEMFK